MATSQSPIPPPAGSQSPGAGPLPPPYSPEQHRARTASRLAFGLLAMLGVIILVHYAFLIALVFWKHDDYAASLVVDFSHSWLPVLSGLAGAAATYYFTTRNEK